MKQKQNFLLGKGERLTENVVINTGGGPKIPPYTFGEAKARLQPMLDNVVKQIDALPDEACPNDYAMATLTLNPEYIAKSYHPKELLRAVGLEAVGSRSRRITPENRSKGREPEETVTTELFVVGKRQAFRRWATDLSKWQESLSPGANQIVELEEVSFPKASSKLKGTKDAAANDVFEVVLHMTEDDGETGSLGEFKQYLGKLKINTRFDRRFYAGGLCFVEIEAPKKAAEDIARFSLVRVVRKMPKLRLLKPAFRTSDFIKSVAILHEQEPLDENVRVAIFDGGIPDDHPITRWATPYDADGVGDPCDSLYEHGVGVTSALLFGHIEPGKVLPRPFSYVDHYRVLDSRPGSNPFELYEVLDRIINVLDTKNYDFINISLGPILPIEDDEIHAWTAVLDEHLSDGETLATIAVGNDGDGDKSIGANRIQVPADCVNALSVGACDVPDGGWKRAFYSSVGPGRSPGIVKPDLVDFGGSVGRPFLTLDAITGTKLTPTGGTSFAAPATLRMGIGVKSHFGNSLSPLAIRALLVHCAEPTDIDRFEVGWGRVSRSVNDIVVCEDNVMRVVFQGTIRASKYLRAPIPLPNIPLKGNVKLKATLCYATACDAHHPDNYTRSGLEVTFRPHKDKKRKVQPGEPIPLHPISKSFFQKEQKSFLTEEELRRDAWKWENCLHGDVTFRGTSLNGSFFDIHYNARAEGRNDTRSQELAYALVVTVEARSGIDLYNQVIRKYATILEPLIPLVDIPISVAV
ncbi:MAG: S8 family peptidase [Sphingobacteriales bacterium]|nr:MAG: S8 family peptidase [Sphingobacteriales bacterium]